jgi:hypothetical protein
MRIFSGQLLGCEARAIALELSLLDDRLYGTQTLVLDDRCPSDPRVVVEERALCATDEAPSPLNQDIARVARQVCRKVARLLARRQEEDDSQPSFLHEWCSRPMR